ncbi:MAG: arylsulfatase [Blastocatellia bacterium]
MSFVKRVPLVLLVVTMLFSVTIPKQSEARPVRRPNIVFIMADDLGYGDLSVYGQRHFQTPNLDRMAAEGIRFTSYYAGSTVCAPSRAALMTGLHTGHGRIRGNGDHALLPEEVTVAEVLRSAGYRTAVFGKWGLGTAATTGRPDRQGFDESLGILDHTHAHRQYTSHLWKNGEVFPIDPERDYVNDLFTRATIDFIDQRKGEPFFIYLAFTSPHAELRVPEDSLDEFNGRFEERPFRNEKADAVLTAEPSRERRPSIGYRSQATPRAAFAAMVTRLDRQVGQVLDALKRAGIDRETIVFFTSDNGPHREGGADPEFFDSNGPFRGIKRDLYEGGIRVPMIVRWPGRIRAGEVSDHCWAHWDFLPTAADVAGVARPGGIDGRSTLPLLLGRREARSSSLYWEFFERGFDQALRVGDWKAVRRGPEGPIELYDLKTDPGETTDLAGRNPKMLRRVGDLLSRARTESEIWSRKQGSVKAF